jgi:spore maturation protein CgeB
MTSGMRIAFFGSSLLSAYWNGAATYYRGIVRALHARGHRITFYEPDAYDRQAHRDIDAPDWARVVVWAADRGPDPVLAALESARGADLVVKASGVGAYDELLEREVLRLAGPATRVVLWDVDAPATLARLEAEPGCELRALVPRYDLVLTYGGGAPVVARYVALGARACVPIYNAHDPDTHHPVAPDPRFAADLAFLGNRLPDREVRVHEFLVRAARLAPRRTFLLGGSGWVQDELPANVRVLGHVGTADHNAFHGTPRAALSINRDSMASAGWSPATRVFEAAAAGACILTDDWPGLADFFAPDAEILVVRDGAEVVALLDGLTPERARHIGARARARALAEHTYTQRAACVEAALEGATGVLVHSREGA